MENELEFEEDIEETLEAEVIPDNHPVALQGDLPIEKKKGKIPLKYKMLAEMAARSYPVDVMAQQLGLKESTIYRLLENNEDIWEEINKIINRIFSDGDRLLANLRKKALVKLDEQLESPNPELVDKAIDKVLKYGGEGKSEGGDRTAIFIGAGGKSQMGVESIEDTIIRMRKERGLPMPEQLEHKEK